MNPDPQALLAQAHQRRVAGDFDAAAALAEEAARRRPKDPAPRLEAALAHAAAGRYAQAESAARKALRLRPAFGPGLQVLAEILARLGKRDESLQTARRAAALEPRSYAARFALGNALFDAQRFAEAVVEFEAAQPLRPEAIEPDYNRARALLNLERYDDAERLFLSCVEREPRQADAYEALAALYGAQSRFDKLFEICDRGIARADAPWGLWQFKADWSLVLGKADECLAHYARALEAAAPDAESHARCRTGRAAVLLTLGRLDEGWREYRWRWDRPALASRHPGLALEPSALPQDLSGRRIRIVQEQGLGDELFFLRYAPALKARGAALEYQAEAKMHALLAGRRDLLDALLPPGEAFSGDLWLHSGDLPEAAGGAVVAPLPLEPDKDLVSEWSARLAALGPPPYVGVTWAAGPTLQEAFRLRRPTQVKRVAPELLGAALRDFAATVVVLQRRPDPDSARGFAEALGRPAHDFSALNEQMADMLAVLSLLDEHVCVSNANAHFAASLGRACRILVGRWPEWRWTASGNTNHWFTRFILYRQGADGNWSQALGQLERDLELSQRRR